MCSEKENLVVALFGPSCSGKTTLGRLLSERNGIPLRCCGNEIVNRSRQLDLDSPQDLPIDEHKKIDSTTIDLANNPKTPMIIEGRFLNYVLNGMDTVIFFEISCDYAIRNLRFMDKYPELQDVSIKHIDNNDFQLINKLYRGPHHNLSCEIIDTGELSKEKCLNKIEKFISTYTKL